MKLQKPLLIASAALLAAGPAWSSDCAARIADLEAQLEEAAEASISASSGGQGVAGAREAEAMQEEEFENEEAEDAPDESASEEEGVTPFQEEEREVEAVERADEAGEGGERVLEAQALLEEAKVHEGDGDVAACEDALERAALLLEED